MPKLIIVPVNKAGVLIDIKQFSEIPTGAIDDAIYYNFIGDFTLDEVTSFAKSLEDTRKYDRVLFNNTNLSYIFERGTLASSKSGKTCSG